MRTPRNASNAEPPCGFDEQRRHYNPVKRTLVAQETIDLLERALGRLATRLRQRLTEDGDRERGARHHAEHRMRQRADPLGVQVRTEQGSEVVLNEFKPLRHRPHDPAVPEIDSLTNHFASLRGKNESVKNEGIHEGSERLAHAVMKRKAWSPFNAAIRRKGA